MSERGVTAVNENDYYENLLDLEGLDPEVARHADAWRNTFKFLFEQHRCNLVEQFLSDPVPEDIAEKLRTALVTKRWIYDGLQALHAEAVAELSPKNLALKELELWSGSPVPQDRLQVETPVREDWLARKVNPSDPGQVLDFYRKTDSYIWELMAANSLIETLFNYNVVLRVFEQEGVAEFLDYGAGAGSFVIAANGLGIRGVHMDLSSKTLEYARWRYEARGLKVQTIEASGRHNDLPRFNAIVCLEVIEHLVEPIALLDAFSEVISPGGLLVVSESCQYVAKFCTHLKSNQWLGGEVFVDEMRRRGFHELSPGSKIHPRIFRRND